MRENQGVRVLFTSTRWTGHFRPLVPFIEACRRRGEEVLVAGPEELAGTAAEQGYPFVAFSSPAAADLEAAWTSAATLSPEEQNIVAARDVFAGLLARASLPDLRAVIEAWKPDVVVREPGEFGAAVAAAIYDVPVAAVSGTQAFIHELFRPVVAERIDDLRRSVRLEPDPDGELLRSSPYLTLFPAVVEDPVRPAPPVVHRFRDADVREAAPLPDWWPQASGPLVYVTFGTVTGGSERLAQVYSVATTALVGEPVRVLLTVGRGVDTAALGPLPPNVHVESWVPQSDVLPHASLVVCHGGSGTTLGALAAGLPLVVVPLFADQYYNARRIEALNAGISVDPPDAAAIAEAVRRVLKDETYRRGAEFLAAEIRALPPTDAAIDFLLEFAAASRAAP